MRSFAEIGKMGLVYIGVTILLLILKFTLIPTLWVPLILLPACSFIIAVVISYTLIGFMYEEFVNNPNLKVSIRVINKETGEEDEYDL